MTDRSGIDFAKLGRIRSCDDGEEKPFEKEAKGKALKHSIRVRKQDKTLR